MSGAPNTDGGAWLFGIGGRAIYDDYALWDRVLRGLVDEFVDILRKESVLQKRHTELKDDRMSSVRTMRFLEFER